MKHGMNVSYLLMLVGMSLIIFSMVIMLSPMSVIGIAPSTSTNKMYTYASSFSTPFDFTSTLSGEISYSSYPLVSSSDDQRLMIRSEGNSWTTAGAQMNNRFTITEDLSTITRIDITWEGYYTACFYSGYQNILQVKTDTGAANIGDGVIPSGSETTKTLSITNNFANYLDANNVLYIRAMVAGQRNQGCSFLDLYCDYVAVTITTATGTIITTTTATTATTITTATVTTITSGTTTMTSTATTLQTILTTIQTTYTIPVQTITMTTEGNTYTLVVNVITETQIISTTIINPDTTIIQPTSVTQTLTTTLPQEATTLTPGSGSASSYSPILFISGVILAIIGAVTNLTQKPRKGRIFKL